MSESLSKYESICEGQVYAILCNHIMDKTRFKGIFYINAFCCTSSLLRELLFMVAVVISNLHVHNYE